MKAADVRKQILKMCDERGWSYVELAKRSDISESTTKSIFTRKNSIPELSTLEKIAENAFGMSAGHFLSLDQQDVIISLDDREIESLIITRNLNEDYRRNTYEYIKRLQAIYEKSKET